MSRSLFRRILWPAAAGPHPPKPVAAASSEHRYRQEIVLTVFTHPATTRTAAPELTRQRVVAEALAVFTDRGSEFRSAACVDVWDWGVSWPHWVVPG
jgi:hypothetical protein